MSLYRKLQNGDPVTKISRTAYNRMIDMLKWWEKNQGAPRRAPARAANQATILSVKNTTGDDQTRFAALAIDAVFPTPTEDETAFANGPVLHGITPVASTEAGNFCVLMGPAVADAIVPACISGVCVAKININSEGDTTCGVDTTTVLQSGASGAQILWKESGTGTKWAVIRVGGGGSGCDRISGLTTAEVTGGGFDIDNVQVIAGANPLDDPESTSETVSIINTINWTADDNKRCFAQWNQSLGGGDGAWEAYQLDGCA